MDDAPPDYLDRKDREAVRALMDAIPALIDLAETHGCEGATRWLELALREIRREVAQAGGTRDH